MPSLEDQRKNLEAKLDQGRERLKNPRFSRAQRNRFAQHQAKYLRRLNELKRSQQ